MTDARDALNLELHALPAGWTWQWLTDVLDIEGGTQPPANTFSSVPLPGYVRLVQIRDFESDAHLTYIPDSTKWRKCQNRDVLIARYGAALGRICRGLTGAYNVALAKTVPADGIDLDFLYHLLRSSYFQHPILAMGDRSAQAGFNKDGLAVIRVPIPPRNEQHAIASVIGVLDDKIELNRRMNETLEATARAIFKDWFVDFGPTRAKMEGRAPYLAPEIWSLFPDTLDEDGKPDGWSVGTLSHVANLNPESWSRANYPDSVDYVDLSNTKWGTIESTAPYVSDAAPSRAQRILRPGDTIVGTVRPGNGSYAFVSAQGLTGSTGFGVLRPIQDIYREAVYLAATSKENIDRLAHLADGGAYPAVRPELVAATALVTASEGVFSAFSCATSGLIDREEANKRENRTLATTRDFLLPKLMSGEIRVRDVEKAAAAAADSP
jgi:type I restriction enzyme S subunit